MPEEQNQRSGSAWGILLAAGSGSRLAAATGGMAKQFLSYNGSPLYWHSARVLARANVLDGIVFVFSPDRLDAGRDQVMELARRENYSLPWLVAAGGALRQDSVRNGLEVLPAGVDTVLVHDSARPFVSAALVRRVAAALLPDREGKAPVAVVPGLPVTDTVKLVREKPGGKLEAKSGPSAPGQADPGGQGDSGDLVEKTLPRERLVAIQTPQGFDLAMLRKAHADNQKTGATVTDDASLMELAGHDVLVVAGDANNVKVTSPADLALLAPGRNARPCCGMGYDVHRYGAGRPLRLGGVAIANAPQVIAHSDGDVLLHALMDALLGCAGLGDIGQHFPDSKAELDGISSAVLLDEVLTMLRDAGVTGISHVDLTIVAQKPRLAPFRDEIRNNVARLLGLARQQVNLKATTEEGLGFTGACAGIKAYAVVQAWSSVTA